MQTQPMQTKSQHLGKAAYLEPEKQLGKLLTEPNQSPAGQYQTDSQLKERKSRPPRVSMRVKKCEVISLCLLLCTLDVALKKNFPRIKETRTLKAFW